MHRPATLAKATLAVLACGVLAACACLAPGYADSRLEDLFNAERDFALPAKMIHELESKTGAGLGELITRGSAHMYRFADIAETIRLGLIGGGMSPAEAARLVETYVSADGMPLREAHVLALEILTNRYVGDQPEEQESSNGAA